MRTTIAYKSTTENPQLSQKRLKNLSRLVTEAQRIRMIDTTASSYFPAFIARNKADDRTYVCYNCHGPRFLQLGLTET
jgi:hypothetical protein